MDNRYGKVDRDGLSLLVDSNKLQVFHARFVQYVKCKGCFITRTRTKGYFLQDSLSTISCDRIVKALDIRP
ncbi:MAG: hypothetical protein ABFD10_04025 [Prolixibacteraceae bacterium]